MDQHTSALASSDTVTVPLTKRKDSPTVTLRTDLTAENSYELLRLRTITPRTFDSHAALYMLWITGWTLRGDDGNVLPATQSACAFIGARTWVKLVAVLEAHIDQFLRSLDDDVLERDEDDEPSDDPFPPCSPTSAIDSASSE